jgi:hypothetical protein
MGQTGLLRGSGGSREKAMKLISNNPADNNIRLKGTSDQVPFRFEPSVGG